ncbi:guanine deaminase-like [Halichondria panicea]|uniref:guanine deaminase-like n=1 Tax=Halichondria panicea TaxID=6063 RepID=UPI00312B8227
MKVIRGTLVHCICPESIQVLENYVIGFNEKENGVIVFVEAASKLNDLAAEHGFSIDSVITLTKSQFLMPGLVDTHIHAPQYVNAGTGYDKQLLAWLQDYTFPAEARFQDLQVARDVYPIAVSRSLRHGTTTASYFATIHLEATKELCRTVERLGQRALIGKVNMDRESPDYYVETTQESLEDTKKFIEFVKELNNPLVQAVITPRFSPSCSPELLQGLGDLAREHDLPIQSHVCEQLPEVKYTLSLFLGFQDCSSIFEKHGLLTDKAYMAHCIHLEENEVQLFQQKGVGISHCPNSNLCLCSGLLDTRKMLDLGLKIGLGTDVSGGYSSSVFDALRKSIDVSKALSFGKQDDYRPISHHEALYMATLGGAKVLSLDDKIGNFKAGKELDALLIDVNPPNNTFDTFEWDSFDDVLMKFLYLGDDRNILRRFVAGKELEL